MFTFFSNPWILGFLVTWVLVRFTYCDSSLKHKVAVAKANCNGFQAAHQSFFQFASQDENFYTANCVCMYKLLEMENK